MVQTTPLARLRGFFPDGTPGVRDVEHPCSYFSPGPPDTEGHYEECDVVVRERAWGDKGPDQYYLTRRLVYFGQRPCEGDGHYLCQECVFKRA
jgi:hypothetical protein